MGEGDGPNSTPNVAQASSPDRFASINPDRCVSDPHIDLIAFDEVVPAGQLETRIRTRSRGAPDKIDNRLRNDYTQLKVAVYEWGERICSSVHTVDVIEREHSSLRAQIEHKKSDVLLKRGDYNLVGELVSLRNRLNTASKEAKQIAQNQIQASHSQTSRRVILDEDVNDNRSIEISMEGGSNEEVFVDDFLLVDECLDSGRREELDISRNIESVLACGLESSGVHSPAIQTHSQGIPNLRSRQDQYDPDHTRNIKSVLARGLKPLGGQGSAVQTHHQGMNSLSARQDQYDEQLVEVQDTLMRISATLVRTEDSNREILEEVLLR